MKAIVAKVLFGGILGCLGWTNSAYSTPINHKPSSDLPQNSTFSAKFPFSIGLADRYRPQIFSLIDYILPINTNTSMFEPALNLQDKLNFSLGKKPYTHETEQTNLVLGFQNTFWPSNNKHKYWGITTVENWGTDLDSELSSSKLNYTNSAPILAVGSSKLTVSGGGNNNLKTQVDLLDQKRENSLDFEQFRGGITYHRGVVEYLTVGLGFVYEDSAVGFTQLTYDSNILPLKTTLSLLTKESKTALHSHVRFQPTQNFVVNYHTDQKKHKFDLNWKMASELALIAKSNSQKKTFSTGIKLAVQNDFLSLSATAALDNNHNLEWNLSSQIGGFKFVHESNQRQSNSKISSNSIDSGMGFQCSASVKYQAKQAKQEQEEFTIWGGRIHSASKINQNPHPWALDLGYGTGTYGKGLIVKGLIALQSNLVLDLDYQEISAVSDETKIKLQLSSK